MLRLIGLVLAILFGAGSAEAAWHQASSEHFVIYSEQSAAELREFAENLERFDTAVRMLRRMDDPPVGSANRLTVFVVRNIGAVQRLIGDRDAAGFYVPRASGSVAFVPRRAGGTSELDLNSETIFLHEYAHHLMMSYHGAVYPDWFVEAFAEFFSTAKFERNGGVRIGLPANHRAMGLALAAPIPLRDILAGRTATFTSQQIDLFYGRSWLLTHYLAFEPTREGQLADYLDKVQAGHDSVAAGEAVFGDLKVLDRELNRYLRGKMKNLLLSGPGLKIEPVEVRPLTQAEAAIMEVRMRSKRGVNREAALELLPKARAAAAPYPNDPFVQTALAEAEFDADNLAEAEAAADRALAADSKWAEALVYKGMIKIRIAEQSSENNPALWREARKWLISAAQLDPDDPEPKMLFYETYIMSGSPPTANAIAALEEAYLLAPQDMSLRITAARQYMIDGKAEQAHRAIAPIASNPHGGPARTKMVEVLAALERKDTKAALALLEAGPGEAAAE